MEIEFKDVSYEDILKNLNFSIELKKINTIIGSIGSGKTTILQLLCQLKAPTKGKIIMHESYNVGYVNQNVEEQFFCETVEKELEYSLNLKKYTTEKKHKRVLDALKMVDLDEIFLKKDPLRLSHSEMKKLSIAKALIINPNILILDDPTSSLDYTSKKSLIKLLKMIKRKYNKTIVIATQDAEFAHLISDKIIAINEGRIIVIGDKYSIYKNMNLLKKNHISVPKIIELEHYIFESKKIRLAYRDEVNDLVKDILRSIR